MANEMFSFTRPHNQSVPIFNKAQRHIEIILSIQYLRAYSELTMLAREGSFFGKKVSFFNAIHPFLD